MFLSGSQRGYTRSGSQWARGRFLMLTTLAAPKDLPVSEWIAHNNSQRGKVRGLVRYVSMHQCGHFMMGSVRFHRRSVWENIPARVDAEGDTIRAHKILQSRGYDYKLSLSGTYGSDGLLLDVPAEVYALGVDLPAELYQAWNKGEGHNGAGREGPSMRQWAETTFPNSRR